MVVSVIVFYNEKAVKAPNQEAFISKAPLMLKSECCEKYEKGNRCKRCPCFDLQ